MANRPDLLILSGPFVDISQPLLSNPEVTIRDEDEDGNVVAVHEAASYEAVFKMKVIRFCVKFSANITRSSFIIPQRRAYVAVCVGSQSAHANSDASVTS